MKLAAMVPVALLVATPVAHAQEPTAFESMATSIAAPCLNSGSTPDTAPFAIAACEQSILDLEAAKSANGPLSPHDLNVYNVVMSMAHSRVASSYGRIDRVRSARVCQRTEQAWTHASHIIAEASPAYAAMITTMVESAAGVIRTCRSEFGTPDGAASSPG